MHIEFKRVHMHNFMSFGDAELHFNDDGFIRVSGVNENPLDNAGSNGSGKSSLWESVIWALTGETIRGTKHVVNIFGADGCFVDLEFYIDKTKYQIIRSKDHSVRKTSLQIFINDQDVSGKGIRDSEKLLAEYLPDITSSLLGSVIILGQGLPQKFTNNTPSGRKEVLEKLSKSDFMIEDLKQRVSKRKSELETESRIFIDSVLQDSTTKNYLVKQIEEQEQLLSSLDKITLETEKKNLEEEHNNLVTELETFDLKIDELTVKFNEYHNKKQQIVADKTSCIESRKQFYEETTAPLKQKKMELSAELKSSKKHLTDIENIREVCPTCGQKIAGVVKPDTSAIKVSIELMETDLNNIDTELAAVEVDFKHEVESIRRTYDDQQLEVDKIITDYYNNIDALRKRKTEVYNKEKTIANNLSNVDARLTRLETTIENCYKIIRENNESINKLEEQIMYNNKNRDLTQSHLEVISKFETALKRDFRGYLLSTVINYIEAKAKQYCKVIFDTDQITFCLDGNNIDISYLNKAYENLSGGERQKIDLIIQFSIRDMLSSLLHFTSNILVLDEVFDGLDSVGCSRIIDMITSITDIKNIFIVTHRKDLSLPTDKDVTVVKSCNSISEIIE